VFLKTKLLPVEEVIGHRAEVEIIEE